ncbi:MAG: zinc-binding alcohol dehydrogenase, partial [Candidatus Poribacteria bacterium]|nr:zinc-binding alcohol dehydrogenase [Candidatus Poribacteria bacterium]
MPKSRRVVFTAPKTTEMQDVTVPDPGDGDVLIDAELTLISPGTERANLLALENTPGTFPRGVGYSMVGHVGEVGRGVTSLKVGDRVVCAASHMSRAVVKADRCVIVPEGVASDEATFFNLAAIAMQGVRKARIEVGEGVAVFGGGLIGLLAARLAKVNGAAPIILMDLHEARRKFAIEFAADASLDPRGDGFKDALAEVFRHSPYAPPQVVIEATGFAEVIVQAFDAAGWMARVVLLGSSRGATPNVDFYRDVHKKGLTLLGAHASTIPPRESSATLWKWDDNVRAFFQLLQYGRMSTKPLITHHVPSEQAPQMFDRIGEWDPNVLGAILDWRA